MARQVDVQRIPDSVKPAFDAIVSAIDAVCGQHLNAEYAELGHRLAVALARKRPSPLLRGKPEVWACGIMYALGSVNFLFDKTQVPHMRGDELSAAFGVSPSSAANKAKVIRDLFRMVPLDPRWCLPSRMDQNPLVWMLTVNGVMVDIRSMPREVQEIAYQKGLIPYIPADRPVKEDVGSCPFGKPEKSEFVRAGAWVWMTGISGYGLWPLAA
jgi:hypothetical protein